MVHSRQPWLTTNSDFLVFDVTHLGTHKHFSSRSPVGNVPVPFSKNDVAASVEVLRLSAALKMYQGIYEGLKVFEGSHKIDKSKLICRDPRRIPRKPKPEDGRLIGWRKGLKGYCLLDAWNARWSLFIEPYKSVLEDQLYDEVEDLRREISGQNKKVIFLDIHTNSDIYDLESPLSHAYLLKCFLEDKWPCRDDFERN